MSESDPTLDSALAALHGSVATDEADDARFAKRIAAGLSNFAPTSRRDLDSVLGAPFPDDHHDLSDEDFAHEAARGDDHDAAPAADAGDVRGWEGSMSEDDRPPNSLSALSGLTRSGPSHSNDPIDGAAKGEDSGLIDLRAMSAPAPEAAAAAAEPAVAHDSGSISVREMSKPAAPTARAASEKSAAVAAAPAAPAVAAAAVAAPKKDEKKKGAGLWIALGGLAAAAAVAAVVIPMSKKADEAPSASAQSSDKGAEKADDKKKDEKVAVAPAASAAPTAEMPAASASAAANEPDPAATVAAAPTGAYAGGSAAKAMQTTPGGMPAKAGSDKGPDPKAPPPAPSSDPIKKPAGGSLDDVLGIGKGNEPVAKKSDPNENLPDKPDSMDVRSAINGKVGAARACVKGHSEASSVSVTFGPGGSVSAVVVTSGEAKGTGAEACIKGAFSTAKVPPSKKGASGSAVLQP